MSTELCLHLLTTKVELVPNLGQDFELLRVFMTFEITGKRNSSDASSTCAEFSTHIEGGGVDLEGQ
jgi:hypothetical protein